MVAYQHEVVIPIHDLHFVLLIQTQHLVIHACDCIFYYKNKHIFISKELRFNFFAPYYDLFVDKTASNFDD